VLSVSFQPANQSILFVRFLDLLPLNSRTRPLLVTTVADQHLISFPLSFAVSDLNQTDLILGHDWAAFLHNSLLGLGYRVDSSFDAWRFASDPTHHIINGAHTSHYVLSRFHIHQAHRLIHAPSAFLSLGMTQWPSTGLPRFAVSSLSLIVPILTFVM
jgi:hypothetical protein